MSKRQVSLHSGVFILEDLRSPAESFRVASWGLPKKMAQLRGQPCCLHRAGAGWVRGEAHLTVHLSKGASRWVAGSNSRDEGEEVGAENFGIRVFWIH